MSATPAGAPGAGRGRTALVVVGVVYVAALVWSALVLPARVPSHFAADGRADGWSSRTALMAMWTVVGLVVLVAMPVLARVASRGDGSLVNMPARWKAYWFATERRDDFARRFADDLDWFIAGTGLFLVLVMAATTRAGHTGADALPGWLLPVAIGAYVLATALWTWQLARRYRPPST